MPSYPLPATRALLTWPAVATGRLVSSIWHISHAAWNKLQLQHSIHGNGTTPPPQRPTVDNGDPFFYAFAGRNQARILHDADVARCRPPPTRRANPPRRPTEQIAPALGVLLTRAASLRATEPLTQGALLDRIFSNFHVANAHVVNAVPNTTADVPPQPPPFPSHRRNCSLCAGRHLDADCEQHHDVLPSSRRSCSNCSGRHYDAYCPFFRTDLPRARALLNINTAPNNRPTAPSDETSHQQPVTSPPSDASIRNAAVQRILAPPPTAPPPSRARAGLLANSACVVSKCVLWCFVVFCGCFVMFCGCFVMFCGCFAVFCECFAVFSQNTQNIRKTSKNTGKHEKLTIRSCNEYTVLRAFSKSQNQKFRLYCTKHFSQNICKPAQNTAK